MAASQAHLDKMQQRQNYRNLWHTDLTRTIQNDPPCTYYYCPITFQAQNDRFYGLNCFLLLLHGFGCLLFYTSFFFLVLCRLLLVSLVVSEGFYLFIYMFIRSDVLDCYFCFSLRCEMLILVVTIQLV